MPNRFLLLTATAYLVSFTLFSCRSQYPHGAPPPHALPQPVSLAIDLSVSEATGALDYLDYAGTITLDVSQPYGSFTIIAPDSSSSVTIVPGPKTNNGGRRAVLCDSSVIIINESITLGDYTLAAGSLLKKLTGWWTIPVVGTVNGADIPLGLFQHACQQQLDNAGKLNGCQPATIMPDSILNQVWEQFIYNILIQQELTRRKITVTDQEAVTAIWNNPPAILQQPDIFKNEAGEFDLAQYQHYFTANPQEYDKLAQFEDYVKTELAINKLTEQILASASTELAINPDSLASQNNQAADSLRQEIMRRNIPRPMRRWYTAQKQQAQITDYRNQYYGDFVKL